ncbi:MAG: hypothetical protein ACTS73_08765 [Arsenophonus sp. NEOnobi-MAG3]
MQAVLLVLSLASSSLQDTSLKTFPTKHKGFISNIVTLFLTRQTS